MERRPPSRFLKLVIGLGLAVALISATARSDSGHLPHLPGISWPGGSDCHALDLASPAPFGVPI
ncbi:hypothetical protein GCM10022223_31040 [Kineosporia mesophila]|uniref:Uncharacterized protein n=1 Tax=Kineosporia mesophila TaxID=566012 RepID=A0ABP6ZPF8_9ACTN|nr:hypothetical protein [Kineosporia mesophila]MCD5349483.1 hypothetical protein [Kineosporia mesophila]